MRPGRPSTRRLIGCLLVVASACTPVVRRTTASRVLPRRLVLALDGIDYRDIAAARERGLFAAFRTPSRLISTFPSISDIAWHEIFGVLPPRGYQRIYYSNAQNSVVGTALDAITPIEFEERMDLAFGTKLHHLGAYLMSATVSRREVNVAVDRFFDITGRPTVYVYNVGPDALQHTRGNLAEYLAYLDRRLAELQRDYTIRTGRALEIVMLSDHGHNHAVDAKFLPVVEALEAHGFRAVTRLSSAHDVAFSVDGVTTGFGVFAQPASVDSVAAVLARMDGVEIVSVRESVSRFTVLSGDERALIERRVTPKGDEYRYVLQTSDPLRFAPIVSALRAAARLDSLGYANAQTWLEASAAARFPAALSRIVRGHTEVTLNPAPILVSIADGFRVGLGMVSIANRMRPLGGTHGALSETNSLGVLMTNFVDTHDDLTTTVRAQVGNFDDLLTHVPKASGARLTSDALLRRDRLTSFHFALPGDTDTDRTSLEVWLSEADERWASDGATFELQLLRGPDTRGEPELLASSQRALSAAVSTSDRRRFLLPIPLLERAALAPLSSYRIRVVIATRAGPELGAKRRMREIMTLLVRTDATGRIAAYCPWSPNIKLPLRGSTGSASVQLWMPGGGRPVLHDAVSEKQAARHATPGPAYSGSPHPEPLTPRRCHSASRRRRE